MKNKTSVNKRPGFIPAGSYFSYDTRAQMSAFAEAELDRLDWVHGVAQDQHIPEPAHGPDTMRPPRPEAALDLAGWWTVA
jgi:hypothetical protein